MPFKRIIIHIILPLALGALMYILFRKDTLIHKWFLPADYYPSTAKPVQPGVWKNFLAFNLPDFCWSYSFASALFIWEDYLGKSSRLFPLFVFFILVVSEMVQLFIPRYFTFDCVDLAATVCAFGLSYLANGVHDKV